MLFAKENCEKTETPRFERRPQYEYQQHQPRPIPVEEKEVKKEIDKTPEKETEETPKTKKEGKKNPSLFDFFGKIQNIGGAMFKDEE